MRALRVAVVAGAMLFVVAGCVAPAVTDGGYRAKTAGTLDVVSSSLATAKLTVDLELQGRTAFALTDELVSQAESDASSAQTSWLSRQPPSDAALALHDRVKPVVQDAVEALQQLRIAVRRGDDDDIRRSWQALDHPIDEVHRLMPVTLG
jgi:hypothetical protein